METYRPRVTKEYQPTQPESIPTLRRTHDLIEEYYHLREVVQLASSEYTLEDNHEASFEDFHAFTEQRGSDLSPERTKKALLELTIMGAVAFSNAYTHMRNIEIGHFDTATYADKFGHIPSKR